MNNRGLVIGRFSPLHKGHIKLISTAIKKSGETHVIVCGYRDEPIPAHVKLQWVRDSFLTDESLQIHFLQADDLPVYPQDDPNYNETWRQVVLDYMSIGPDDAFFTGDDYGDSFARAIGMKYVSVPRASIPCSGTMIRADPLKHWGYVSYPARPYLIKKVRILGPESSGKSTLALRLAQQYKTVAVPEYGRTYCEQVSGKHWGVETIDACTIGQPLEEDAAARMAPRGLMFCDTDSLTTLVWADLALGYRSPALEQIVASRHYDLTLLLAPDIEWADDGLRNFKGQGWKYFDAFKRELDSRYEPYTIIRGKNSIITGKTRRIPETIARASVVVDEWLHSMGHTNNTLAGM